jgi:hypothetical protein
MIVEQRSRGRGPHTGRSLVGRGSTIPANSGRRPSATTPNQSKDGNQFTSVTRGVRGRTDWCVPCAFIDAEVIDLSFL